MNKRTIFLAALAIFVIVFSILGYLNIADKPDSVSPYKAISSKACAILNINNYNRAYENLMFKNLMWQELMDDEEIHTLNHQIRTMDSLFRALPNFSDIEEDLSIVIAFYPNGKSGFNHTIILPCKSQNGDELIEAISEMAFKPELYGTFEGTEIYTIQPKDTSLSPFYAALENELVILSFLPDMTEDAIRIAHSDNALFTDKEFTSVQRTTGDFTDWNFFINYRERGGMRLLGIEVPEAKDEDLIWSGWTALDATMHPDLILFNGFTHSGPDTYLSLFDKQKSQDIDAVEIIPDDVSLFFHFGVSNYPSYSEARKKYFEVKGKGESYAKKLEELNNEFHFDTESELNKWVANEFGVMYLKDKDLEPMDSKLIFFRISDKKEALALMNRLSEESDQGLDRLPVTGLLDDFETVLFEGLDRPYYAFVGKYLVLSTSAALVDHVLEKYKRGQTLKKSQFYNELSANLSDQSNVYLYVHLNDGLPVYRTILQKTSLEFFNENPEFLKKFEHLGIQFKDGKKNMFYQHTALDYNPNRKHEGNTLWEVELDTLVLMKPRIVLNHYTNAREIFIQDVGNKIYLIDNKGNIIWKRQLKEPILSEVYQIDVFKNNKLQILFSGESSIYLIDRKGRDVENYPIQLSGITTNGLSVIDYEKNREYRLLIGLRGGKILNFDRSGKEIEGWDFKQSEEIVSPIQHFVLNGKDYITCVGSDGSIFVLNRRGEIRIPIKEHLPVRNAHLAKLELSNDVMKCKYVTTDETGNVFKLNFEGEKEIINFEQFSSNHQFVYGDINNDRKPDYTFLDSNRLMSFNHAKEKIFEISLESASLAYPALYRFNEDAGKIGLSDTTSKMIMLYNEAGIIDDKFPLKGNSEFSISDINKDERYNVIVGLGKKLVVYNLE